jgi:hypothetical protein
VRKCHGMNGGTGEFRIRILNLMSMYIAHKPKDPYIDLTKRTELVSGQRLPVGGISSGCRASRVEIPR